MFRGRKRRKPPILDIVILALVLLWISVCSALGTFRMELQLDSQQEIVLEYGSDFTPESVSAVIKSPLFGEYSLTEPANVYHSVRTDTVGNYDVVYSVGFLWMQESIIQHVKIQDTQAPTITLVPDEDTTTLPGEAYEEAGFSAWDGYDGDITHLVQKRQEGNAVIYTVTDSSGNKAEIHRTIRIEDSIAPELTLKGEAEMSVPYGTQFEDPGCTAIDNVDGVLTDKVQAQGDVNVYAFGSYTVTYTVTDSYGNTATITRKVTVVPAHQPQIAPPNGKVIYLTFDDGPSVHTSRLLEILKKYNVKATFFVTNSSPMSVLADMASDGHAIGVHTASHVYKEIYASEEAFFRDFKIVYDKIEEITGIKTTLMRFPGGSSNTVSRFNKGIMSRLTKLVTDYGLQYFDWNVNSNDAGGTTSSEGVYNNVIAGVSGKDYSVVLQHDIHGYSVDAVELIIQWGLANGYTFLPLDSTSPNCHHTVRN